MRLCLLANGIFKCFRNPEIGHSVTFGASGSILASAIYRMSKSRYKVYVIGDCWFSEKLCYGISEALSYLKTVYSS